MRRLVALALGLGLLAAAAPARPPEKPKTYDVPYRLTDTKHVLVRAKINGKGPFNLILDTGAPAVFITKAVAKKAGVEVDGQGWGTFGGFELEGGLKVDKVKTRVEDLLQLDGMNSMGLAGVELHGVVGYNVLAKFRIAYDFTADKLAFEELAGFEPPAAMRIEGKAGDDLQQMSGLVKLAQLFTGLKPNFDVVPRGFVGVEVADADGGVVVKKVLAGSPAEKAGVEAGDVITAVKAADVTSDKQLSAALAKAGVGTSLQLTVTRGGKSKDLTVELGKGL